MTDSKKVRLQFIFKFHLIVEKEIEELKKKIALLESSNKSEIKSGGDGGNGITFEVIEDMFATKSKVKKHREKAKDIKKRAETAEEKVESLDKKFSDWEEKWN